MALSKIDSGLILFEDCEEWDGWSPPGEETQQPSSDNTYILETSLQYSGLACFGMYMNSAYSDTFGAMLSKVLNVGSGGGRRLHIYHKSPDCPTYGVLKPVIIGNQSITHSGVHDWTNEALTISDNVTGNVTVNINYGRIPHACGSAHCYVDHLLICKNDYLTVQGVVGGQKVAIFRASDDQEINHGTCAVGETQVAINLGADEPFPEMVYLKVYGTDGYTLIDITLNFEVCGGDVWAWYPTTGDIILTSDAEVIYRNASETGTPKSATITATVLYPDETPAEDVTVFFSTRIGSLSETEVQTDENGQATTVLTSSTDYGMTVVAAKCLGGNGLSPGAGFIRMHIYYDVESADAEQEFQFYVEGKQYAHGDGKYERKNDVPGLLEVDLTENDATISKLALVSIYRLGVQEWAGIVTGRNIHASGDSVSWKVKGADNSRMLSTRVIPSESYSDKTPAFILNDLLTKYPCGVTVGDLGDYTTRTLTITFDNLTLLQAIEKIAAETGWTWRVNLDRSFDFAASFPGNASIASFVEGDVENPIGPDSDSDQNYLSAPNRIFLRGADTTTRSVATDTTSVEEVGLLEAPDFQSEIEDQEGVEIACQAELQKTIGGSESQQIYAKDTYPTGTYDVESFISVTSEKLNVDGSFAVKVFERDLSDAYWVRFELTSRRKSSIELDERYRRMAKEAATAS